MKILIIQTAFIGDVILSLPLVQTLKKNHSDYIIDYLCIPYTREVLNNQPYLNEIIVFDKHREGKYHEIQKISNYLKKKKYDIAIIPHKSVRSALIALLSGIPVRLAFEKPFFNWLYTKTYKYNPEQHEVERDLTLISDFNIYVFDRFPKLFSQIRDKEKIISLMQKYKIRPGEHRVLAIAPGSIWKTKRWIMDYYRELCLLLSKNDYYIFIIGNESDRAIASHINHNSKNVFNLCGELNIPQTLELLKKCDLLISNDSAPVHIASSIDKPVIDIFGPTVPEFGFYPLNKLSICLGDKSLNCRPCGKHGSDKCPTGNFECMKNIKPVQVLQIVKKVLCEL